MEAYSGRSTPSPPFTSVRPVRPKAQAANIASVHRYSPLRTCTAVHYSMTKQYMYVYAHSCTCAWTCLCAVKPSIRAQSPHVQWRTKVMYVPYAPACTVARTSEDLTSLCTATIPTRAHDYCMDGIESRVEAGFLGSRKCVHVTRTCTNADARL